MEKHGFAIFVSFLALAVAPLRPAPARAEEPARAQGAAFVQVRAEGATAPWKARAIQESVAHHLAGMDRLRLADGFSLKDLGCLELETDCIVAALRARSTQVFIRGTLDGQELRLSALETWT